MGFVGVLFGIINLVINIAVILFYLLKKPETELIWEYYGHTKDSVPEYNYLTFGSRNYKCHVTESPFQGLMDIPMTDDIIAIQFVRIPNEDWKNSSTGAVEHFRPKRRDGRHVVAQSYTEEIVSGKKYKLSFGLSISPNIGFNITGYDGIKVVRSTESKGAVYVSGIINNEKVMIWSVYGEWDRSRRGYDKLNNIDVLRQLFKKSEGYKVVALGSINVPYKEMKKLENELSFKMEEGPLLTVYQDGYRGTDHVMVKNCKIVKQPTIMSIGNYHEWFTDIRVNIGKQHFNS